jgi:ceramidase
MWSIPIDLYCERVSPSFWAEPVNAVSNLAFLIAAIAAFDLWRRAGKSDRSILALVAVIVAVGFGSFAFHTLATRGAMWLDVIPIGLFIYGYFLLAMRRFLLLSWSALMLLVGFIALSTGLGSLIPREALNGSSGYLPALAALIKIESAPK